jgi:adenine deaminase
MPARQGVARVIGIVPGEITTEHHRWEVAVGADGTASSRDGEVCRLAVIERHGRNGNVGLGFVSGLGLGAFPARAVAIGATVAHDSHNLVIAGTSESAMHMVAQALAEAGGGFAVVADGELTGLLALPVAGLMADRTVEAVAAGTALVNQAARAAGAVGESPLMTLSFLALPVIPALKLTDRGLVDVARFEHVPLWIE